MAHKWPPSFVHGAAASWRGGSSVPLQVNLTRLVDIRLWRSAGPLQFPQINPNIDTKILVS